MILERMLNKSRDRPGMTGNVLTLENAQGWDGWVEDTTAMSRDRAMKLSTVSRCVELRANAMAMLPVYLMNEGTKARIDGHPLTPLLWGQVNEAMNRFDYEKLLQGDQDLAGNAYAWINRDPRTGRPVELIPLRPRDVTPYVDNQTGLLWYVYAHPRGGGMCRIDPADILHYKAYTTDGIEGISILSRAAQSVATGLAAQQYQSDLYANGGRPSGILKTATDLGGRVPKTDSNGEPVLDEEGRPVMISKKELIRQAWEKVHNGPGKNFRIAVLDLGLEYQPVALSNSEAQFVESEELRVADIARFFGIPLYLLNAGKQAYSSNEQNSIDFVKHTLLPLIVQREQEDTGKLLLPRERSRGLRLKREAKQLLRGDTAAQAAWYKAMREIGAYSVNDIRALEDLAAVEGGQERYASLNYVPLGAFDELSRLRALQGRQEAEKE